MYYGLITGTILDKKYIPLVKEMFGDPAIKHKFVKGLEDKLDVSIYRKSGTWRDYHADAGIFDRGDLTYIAVVISQTPRGKDGGGGSYSRLCDAGCCCVALACTRRQSL